MNGRIAPLAFLVVALLGLSGCGSLLTESTATLSGVAGAATGAAITSNATVAAAVGLGIDSAAREGLRYVERRVHRSEQDRIAEAAGPLPVNAVASWSVSHDLPIERDEHGQVVVSREFGGLGFRCKEIVFSVDTAKKSGLERAFYTANICSDGKDWRWASAEPTTRRWGGLQ
jgi:uncharacterized protein YceK